MGPIRRNTRKCCWLGIIVTMLLVSFSQTGRAYYFGPPSQSASLTLVDSMGPSAPTGMTVIYNKTLNRMEIVWTVLQNSDDRNYGAYPIHNLHATTPYVLEVRVDDAVDAGGVPLWTPLYTGNQASQNQTVSYGHKYVYRVAGMDEAPYANIGLYRSSTDNPANHVYSAPTTIFDVDAILTAANSSAMVSWAVPISKSPSLTYNIYGKVQSMPLVSGDLILANRLTNVAGTGWLTQGGRSYLRWEHVPATSLIAGGPIDVNYAVCAVDSEGHEADISSGTGNRVLNSDFESGSLYWLSFGSTVEFANNVGRPVHSGIWSARIDASAAADWQTVYFSTSAPGRPKTYKSKNAQISAWVRPSTNSGIAIRAYSYNASGVATFLEYKYYDSLTQDAWQQLPPFIITCLSDTETIEARFLANKISYFDDISIVVPDAVTPTKATIYDNTPPQPITTLDVYAKYSQSALYLEWFNPSDAIGAASFRVYRNGSGQGPVTDANKAAATKFDVPLTALNPPSGTAGVKVAWTNTDPWAGYFYYYGVAAKDLAGNEALVSNSMIAQSGAPYDTVPPIAVTMTVCRFDKSASPPNPPHKIHLEWLAATDMDNRGTTQPIKHYNLFRKIGSTPFTSIVGLTPIAEVASTVWHEDEDILPNTTYYYAVAAEDISVNPNLGGNMGTFYNSMGVTTDTLPPAFLASYTATNNYWCSTPGNGNTTTVKNNNATMNKYINGNTIDIEVDLGETGLVPYMTADFTQVDNYGFNTIITDNANGKYRITHVISISNTIPDNTVTLCADRGYAITITAYDQYNNGPAIDTTFDVQLDNIAPKAP